MQPITWAEFLDLPRVAFVAFGHDEGPVSYVFADMPSLDFLRDVTRWSRKADYRVRTLIRPEPSLTERWPDAIFVNYHCACCGEDDLVVAATCCDCGRLWGRHSSDCFWGLSYGPEWSRRYELWQRGYSQGRAGRQCTQRTLEGRRGYLEGRKTYKKSRRPWSR